MVGESAVYAAGYQEKNLDHKCVIFRLAEKKWRSPGLEIEDTEVDFGRSEEAELYACGHLNETVTAIAYEEAAELKKASFSEKELRAQIHSRVDRIVKDHGGLVKDCYLLDSYPPLEVKRDYSYKIGH